MTNRFVAVMFTTLCVPMLAGLWGCDEESEQAPVETTPAKAATTPKAAAKPAVPAAPKPTPSAADRGPKAQLGEPAPDFTLQGVDGESYSLKDFRGKTVVLEWFNPDCPFVRFAHTKGPLSDMAKRVKGEQLVWLSINSGAPGKQGHGLQRNKRALEEYDIENPVLLDPEGTVGRSYGAEKTPHMFVVDDEGKLVYRGAIDNAPIGKVDPDRPRFEDSKASSVVNYVQGALQDLKQERALRLAETPAYGCSVKYES